MTRFEPRDLGGPRATGALLLLAGLLAGPPLAASEPPPPSPTPSLAARADRLWEGMVRRERGLALAGRWRLGTLAFKEETLRWTDAKDPGRNLVLPAGRIVSHRRACRVPAEADTCFEWSFRTVEGETYVFRDERGESGRSRVGEVFTFVEAVLPALPAETAAGKP